jgi:cadmium resistance protein CadD (predicted permease)
VALGALLDIHKQFAWFVVIGNGLAGVWAIGAHLWTPLRRRVLWWFTAVVQVAIFVQVILGVTVQNREDIESPEYHTFYGFVAIIAVGIIYAYKEQVAPHRYLLYGLGGLFLMGLGIRSMILA